MITPDEIENKAFRRSVSGYNRDEVDEFLDRIIVDMSRLIAEKDLIQAENQKLKAENEKHRASDLSIMNTLDSAKKLIQDIAASAEKRSDIILRNAKLDAETIVKEARESVSQYSGEGKDLKDRIRYFRSRYKQLLQEELDYIDDRGGDLLADMDKEFFALPEENTDPFADRQAGEGYAEEKAAAEIFSALERDLNKEVSDQGIDHAATSAIRPDPEKLASGLPTEEGQGEESAHHQSPDDATFGLPRVTIKLDKVTRKLGS